jgi:RNA polymerase sigma-70 factor (ECF subfamily)
MSTNPVVSESESGPDQSGGPAVAASPALGEPHSQRIAELFRDEYAKLVHYLVASTGSWAEARDIASQAFAQVLEMRDPDTVSFLKAYVYRAARNLATNRARLGAIRGRINQIVCHEFTGISPSPEPLFMDQQRLEVLQRAIERLRPTRRMVLKWRMWEELPYAEIESRFAAEGLAVNERTLNRWYAEGLKELRQAIREAEEPQSERARP